MPEYLSDIGVSYHKIWNKYIPCNITIILHYFLKYNIDFKTLSHWGISDPECSYEDLVYKFGRYYEFSAQFKMIYNTHYKIDTM